METFASAKMQQSPVAPSFHVLIVAGGRGERMGGPLPKQYMSLAGKPILRHTIEAFLGCPGLGDLRVVINPNHKALYEQAVEGFDLPPPTFGDKDRKLSVYNGLNDFSYLRNEDIILIHDSVRPFLKNKDIQLLVKEMAEHESATLAVPLSDTLIHEKAGTYPDRRGLWAVQTPQAFRYGLIRRAHEQRLPPGQEITDDTGLAAFLGVKTALVPGSRENFKITTPDDLKMAEKMLENRPYVTRTGTGFDVHAFDFEKNTGFLRIGGVDIPHKYPLKGHSDADVALHALTDALLGALAAGDIGQHFPPSDPQWRGADSAVFLKAAVDMITARGGRIVNLDLTIICEAPKIGPHRERLQGRISDICGVQPGQVGIKATTTEGLGFTGRGEGIAAQAVTTIECPP